MKTENRATKFFYTIIEMLCTLMLVTLSPGTFLCKLFFLSIESRVHMCVRRIFFVEQLNIGKTEGGGGLIWSKLTLFRHPIILEETVFFLCQTTYIYKTFFYFNFEVTEYSWKTSRAALLQAFIWGETSLKQKQKFVKMNFTSFFYNRLLLR